MDARTPFSFAGRRARLAAALAVAAATLVLGLPGGTPAGDAADRYVAGGPVEAREPVLPDRAAALLAMAAGLRARLGLAAPASSRVEHVADRLGGAEYDEVRGLDREGRAIHLQRLDARGRLVAAVTFGWQVNGGRPLAGGAAAAARARRVADDLAFAVTGAPDVVAAPDDGGWTASWPRLVDGIPVVGDGTRIELWPDGRVHAVVRTERELAARPATLLDERAARARATTTLAGLFGSAAAEIAVARVTLAWIAPNDAFDPTAPDAPGSTLRLAWVAEARTTGALAESLRAVKLFLDAGTGTLLGGDVLR